MSELLFLPGQGARRAVGLQTRRYRAGARAEGRDDGGRHLPPWLDEEDRPEESVRVWPARTPTGRGPAGTAAGIGLKKGEANS